MLANVVQVLRHGELGHFLALLVHHPQLAVIEVHMVVLVHQTHVVGLVGEGVADDEVQVVLVGQHHVVQDLDGQLAELYRRLGDLLDLGPLLLVEALAYAAGQAAGGMNIFATDHGHHLVSGSQSGQHLPPYLHAHLADDPHDVAFGGRSIRPHHEVGAAQGVEVGGVVGHEEGAV